MNLQFRQGIDRLAEFVPGAPAMVALGLALTAVSVWQFSGEVGGIGDPVGTIVAAALDVPLSLLVVLAGYWLHQSDFDPAEEWVVTVWTLLSMAVAVVLGGAMIAIQAAEGRGIGQPLFVLSVVGTLGALAGVVIGYLYVSVAREARRARRTRDAIAFVNSVLRHDVLNGLQVIRTHTEIVAEADDERVDVAIEGIDSKVNGLLDHIDRVRAIADVLEGDPDLESVDIAGVIEEVAATTRESHPNASVEVDVPPECLVSGTDALSVAFVNLVTNAVEHHDGDEPRVRVSADRDGDTVTVTVADDGPGIPEDERDWVFERGASTAGGGLGLHIVETIVENLGGSIRVTDSDLGGAAFVVELPAAS